MKKILASALILPILGFSYDVNFNKTFTKNIDSDILVANILLSVEKKDEKIINKEIEKFNTFIKNTKNITIKNTNYSLIPKYEYSDNKRHFVGYVGENRLSISSKEAKDINKFLNKVIEYKNKNSSNDTKLNISNLSWEISNEKRVDTADELRVESLIWANKYAKELSKKVSKKCELNSIDINESSFYPIARSRFYEAKLSSSNESDIAPINNEQEIKIDVNITMDCK